MKKLLIALFLSLIIVSACYAKEFSVLDFGAVADGKTDCTQAFQTALDTARDAGGGVVNVPSGRYRIDGNLVINSHVTLEGSSRIPPLNSNR
ncbi:MAG: glycosyl hydrolase family 28-related protein, partial [Armatimonadota bacterium]